MISLPLTSLSNGSVRKSQVTSILANDERFASTAKDPRSNWISIARGGKLSPNPDGAAYPDGVLDDGEEYTKHIYTEGDRSFPVVQTARGVYAYPASVGDAPMQQVVISGKEARAALLAADARDAAALAEFNAEIQAANQQLKAELNESGGGWADSRQPEPPRMTSSTQIAANAASVARDLFSADGWSAVGIALKDSLRNAGGINGPGFDVRRGPVISATPKQQDAALRTLSSVPAFFEHELEFSSAIAPVSFSRVRVAAGANSSSSAFGGALYPQDKLRQLVPYLEKRGVSVYGTNGNPRFDARWDGTGTMYLPANPTVLQVKHELSHYLDFRNNIKAAADVRSGVQSYVNMGRIGREEAVLDRLRANRSWQSMNDAEREFSIEYVNRLKREAGQ